MKLDLIETKEILDFEQEIGYELVVHERPIHSGLSPFYACFKGAESMEDGCLVGRYGNGNTVDEALSDYCKQISCRRMVFGAYTPERKEIQFPYLKHSNNRVRKLEDYIADLASRIITKDKRIAELEGINKLANGFHAAYLKRIAELEAQVGVAKDFIQCRNGWEDNDEL